MTNPFAFDTNILIYSVDPSDPRKHTIADQVVKTATQSKQPLPLHCVTEFYRAVTRKRLLDPQVAERFVLSTIRANEVVSPDATDVANAIRSNISDNLQFFDALLLATASRAGCTTLFSEDFQHDRTYGGVTVRDPFLLTDDERDLLLA